MGFQAPPCRLGRRGRGAAEEADFCPESFSAPGCATWRPTAFVALARVDPLSRGSLG